MRLSKDEIDGIKRAFEEVFKEGKIYLFGSRVDDNKRGGRGTPPIKLNKK